LNKLLDIRFNFGPKIYRSSVKKIQRMVQYGERLREVHTDGIRYGTTGLAKDYLSRRSKRLRSIQVGTIPLIGALRVTICKGRRERREVLFARQKVGRGKSGPKDKKYDEKSKVRC
jgi:hypothetical protein